VERDLGEPGRQARPAVELPEVLERFHPGLLESVLRLPFVEQDGARDAEEALVVAAHQQLEERSLAGEDAAGHLLVGDLGGGLRGTPGLEGHGAPQPY
jgi:hypothetical protein